MKHKIIISVLIGCIVFTSSILGYVLYTGMRCPSLEFTVSATETPKLLINSQESIPPFSWDQPFYDAPSLTTENQTTIEIGSERKIVTLTSLNRKTLIHFQV